MSKEPQRLRKYPPLPLPPSIKVGYRDYTVEEMSDEGRDTHVGFHFGQLAALEINTEFPPDEVVCTLLHEIIHAVFDVAGFTFRSKDDEEDVTICLGNGLTQVFKDNPHITKWILNTLNDPEERGLQKSTRV
jgi:hypothetical protein